MATKIIPLYADTSGIIVADQAATPSTVAYRDSSGNLVGVQVSGSELKSTGTETSTPVAKAATFTAAVDGSVYICDASGGAIVANLPAVAGVTGRKYTFKRISASNNVTVTAAGAETIDGANTYVLSAQYQKVTIQSDGAKWNVIA